MPVDTGSRVTISPAACVFMGCAQDSNTVMEVVGSH